MKKLSNAETKQIRGGVGIDQGNGLPGAGRNGWGYPSPFNPSGNENAGLGKNFGMPEKMTAGESGNTIFIPGDLG